MENNILRQRKQNVGHYENAEEVFLNLQEISECECMYVSV